MMAVSAPFFLVPQPLVPQPLVLHPLVSLPLGSSRASCPTWVRPLGAQVVLPGVCQVDGDVFADGKAPDPATLWKIGSFGLFAP